MGLEIDLDGRTAIITGGGRGIGRSIATVLADAGANVAVAARTEEEIGAVAEEIRESGGNAIAVPTDLRDLDELEQLMRETEAQLDNPDILINNAGVSPRGPMLERTEADADLLLSVNLKGTFFLSQLFAESYIRSETETPGRIINISSIYAHIGVPSRTLYGATKSGIQGLTRGLSIELAEDDITVNSISPGRVLVDRIRDLEDDDDDGDIDVTQIPLGRLGSTSEIAYACAFLSSDLGGYITGEDIAIDGGVKNTSAPYPIRRPSSEN